MAKEGLCFKMEEYLGEGVVKREAGRDGRPVHKKEKAAPPHLDPLMINKTSLLKSSKIVKVIRKLSS